MTLLLKDAILPNLVQTLEGGPALIHGGPFGNIAHGCNSIAATRLGLGLADIVLTEAGFGADLGAEKFFDIKCRYGGLNPEAAIVVATVRALKMHGGVKKENLGAPDVAALQRGMVNLEAHVKNVQKFGVPAGCGAEPLHLRHPGGAGRRAGRVQELGRPGRAERGLGQGWGRGRGGREGGAGRAGRGEEPVPAALRREPAHQEEDREDRDRDLRGRRRRLLRDGREEHCPVGGRRSRRHARLHREDPVLLLATIRPSSGDPKGFRITIRDVYPSAGAGFVVALAGEIMTMPGLSKTPAAEAIRVLPDGTIEGLF